MILRQPHLYRVFIKYGVLSKNFHNFATSTLASTGPANTRLRGDVKKSCSFGWCAPQSRGQSRLFSPVCNLKLQYKRSEIKSLHFRLHMAGCLNSKKIDCEKKSRKNIFIHPVCIFFKFVSFSAKPFCRM